MNVVILNDTATRYHHGCKLVMQNLVSGLEERGLTIALRVASGTDWEADPQIVSAMAASDLIVINGEGTLHHGRAAGERLLRVGLHPSLTNVPKAIVNMLFEDNPTDWHDALKNFDLLAARDSTSYAELLKVGVTENLRWLPDLSMAAPILDAELPRHGALLGDSVKWNRRQELAQLAKRIEIPTFCPTKTLASKLWTSVLAKRMLYAVYMGCFSWWQPKFIMAPTPRAYLDVLAQSSYHVTGRFHAICLSMLTQTPFFALTSNASKIERLLTDVGIGLERILDPSRLDTITRDELLRPFSDEEHERMSAYLQLAQAQAAVLFDDLLALASKRVE